MCAVGSIVSRGQHSAQQHRLECLGTLQDQAPELGTSGRCSNRKKAVHRFKHDYSST